MNRKKVIANIQDLNRLFSTANRIYRLRMKIVYDIETIMYTLDRRKTGPNRSKNGQGFHVFTVMKFAANTKGMVTNIGITKLNEARRFSVL